jgi:hypothetical protein
MKPETWSNKNEFQKRSREVRKSLETEAGNNENKINEYKINKFSVNYINNGNNNQNCSKKMKFQESPLVDKVDRKIKKQTLRTDKSWTFTKIQMSTLHGGREILEEILDSSPDLNS